MSVFDSKAREWAQRRFGCEVEAGRIVRATACEACGSGRNVHGHHDDYLKPLEVRWLCRSCHKRWHDKHGPGANWDAPLPPEAAERSRRIKEAIRNPRPTIVYAWTGTRYRAEVKPLPRRKRWSLERNRSAKEKP